MFSTTGRLLQWLLGAFLVVLRFFFSKTRGAGQPQKADDTLDAHKISFTLKCAKGKQQWLAGGEVFLKESKLPAKNAGERLLSAHMKQRQGIFELLPSIMPSGNLAADTFLSFYLAAFEAKQQQS